MHPPGHTDRKKHYVFYLSVRPSVRSSVRLLPNREHDVLKTNELILMPIGTSGPQCKGTKNGQLWGQEVKGQGHTRPKLDLEVWRRYRSRAPTSRGLFLVWATVSCKTSVHTSCHRQRCYSVLCSLIFWGKKKSQPSELAVLWDGWYKCLSSELPIIGPATEKARRP